MEWSFPFPRSSQHLQLSGRDFHLAEALPLPGKAGSEGGGNYPINFTSGGLCSCCWLDQGFHPPLWNVHWPNPINFTSGGMLIHTEGLFQSITCLVYQSFIQGASTFLSWAAGPSHSVACKQHNLLFDGKVIINLRGNEDGNDLKSYRFVILLSAWCLQESSKIFSRKISPKHSFTFHVKILTKKNYRMGLLITI